ncbi:STAS domain-containing protein [Streptomyces olivoreticuli]|uniref:STAS domain-containing protein n=1 Tax=Streptomyces olivoreticuli TaxID=68246 RepID=UPI000E24BE20|nr:STAS domain-containing protein [Streptomyces olivoreticuli]
MGIKRRDSVPEPPAPPRTELPKAGLNARSYVLDGVTVVQFHGDIDLAIAVDLQEHVDAATSQAGSRVVIDLRQVQFMDCTTLTLLCRARRRAVEGGGSFALICTRPWHLRILKAAELHTVLRPVATLDDALACTQGHPD